MQLLPKFKKKPFFTDEQNNRIIEAIRLAERQTSGEIRVYIESRCRFVDALHRAEEIFRNLKMDHTVNRNAVLLYVAVDDRQFAIFADQGIHTKLGNEFWEKEVRTLGAHFSRENYRDALLNVIHDIGESLHAHFPFDGTLDKNELPDDIVFGK